MDRNRNFWPAMRDSGLRGIYEFNMLLLQGEGGMGLRDYEVPSTMPIRNEHILGKLSTPYLQGLWRQ